MCRLLLPIIVAVLAAAQTIPVEPLPTPQFLITTGAGFKPYQTPIRAGSSAYVEGGYQFAKGFWTFARVEMRPTDAQMLWEGCKQVYGAETSQLMVCGGPGFGVDNQNVGISFTGGGKWFWSPRLLQKQNVAVSIQMGVDKQTVPAPVSDIAVISPVQPSFRFGVTKVFR